MIFEDIQFCIEPYYQKRSGLFKRLMGNRVIDALLHMPSYSIEKIVSNSISKDDIGKQITTKFKVDCVESSSSNKYHRPKSPTKIYGKVGDESVEILLFNYRGLTAKRYFPIGENVYISGKLSESFSGMLQFINPQKAFPSAKSGVFNIYPLTTGILQESVYSVIKSALNILQKSNIEEWIPEDILEANNFKSFYDSLFEIHNPQKIIENQLENIAIKRLSFDELLAEQLTIRLSNPKTKQGNIIKNEKKLISKLLVVLPFSLTHSQNKVISEIFNDMESGSPMTRLLQGDVGSGKTIVAIISALYAIESGFQCAILAPTEILARQHYKTINRYFEALNLHVELLTSNEKGKKRKEILESVQNGNANVLVGTHAIITDQVNFQNLGLVIVDEQHRFGVNQRLQLIEKGVSPHVLSMTATPIPRTIIMSLYGDIEVSSVTEKPVGRKEIITKAISTSKISEVVDSIKNITSKGEKVYWVCPLIEESSKTDYTCVINRFEYLKKSFGDEVLMLHGKMKPLEKQEIFKKFAEGNCNILVSTTVIEVGVDVPNASVIIIENAEKFGLAQLHQLRGRVGRSDIQSYCILLFEQKCSDIARKRISILKETNDGFLISEEDLKLRGGGEILGTKQSGQKKYKIFDVEDPRNQKEIYKLLTSASKLASKIIASEDTSKYETLLEIFAPQNFENIKKSF